MMNKNIVLSIKKKVTTTGIKLSLIGMYILSPMH